MKCEPCLLFSQRSCSDIIGLAVELFVCSFSQIAHITRNVRTSRWKRSAFTSMKAPEARLEE